MDRYIAVDSGKFATKIACYDEKTNKTKQMKFHTRMSVGFFEDDAIESATFVAQVGDKVYKIGRGARQQADMETSKKAEIHKVCTLAAIAMMCDPATVDTVHVAVGIPVKAFEDVKTRNEYREYILPDGVTEVTLKKNSTSKPVKVRFEIKTRLVCPESCGVLYLHADKYKGSTTGIIDIGNLNINGTVWNGFDLDPEYSVTNELGGNVLIQGLAQDLSARFSRCDANLVASILNIGKNKPDLRKLVPVKPNPLVEEESKKAITEYLRSHVRQIKAALDTKHWSLDYMNLVFIGGTSELLTNEIYEVFGDDVTIEKDPSYANVMGFLVKLCARTIEKSIPTNVTDDTDSIGDHEEIPQVKREKEKKPA